MTATVKTTAKLRKSYGLGMCFVRNKNSAIADMCKHTDYGAIITG
jgi:hypothetical protein